VIVATTGASGAFAVSPAGTSHVLGHRVKVVDTVGAGDTFMSALIHGLIALGFDSVGARDRLRLIDDGALTKLIRLGADAAAITVSKTWRGPAAPRGPDRDELRRQP
jgi:fructokinase